MSSRTGRIGKVLASSLSPRASPRASYLDRHREPINHCAPPPSAPGVAVAAPAVNRALVVSLIQFLSVAERWLPQSISSQVALSPARPLGVPLAEPKTPTIMQTMEPVMIAALTCAGQGLTRPKRANGRGARAANCTDCTPEPLSNLAAHLPQSHFADDATTLTLSIWHCHIDTAARTSRISRSCRPVRTYARACSQPAIVPSAACTSHLGCVLVQGALLQFLSAILEPMIRPGPSLGLTKANRCQIATKECTCVNLPNRRASNPFSHPYFSRQGYVPHVLLKRVPRRGLTAPAASTPSIPATNCSSPRTVGIVPPRPCGRPRPRALSHQMLQSRLRLPI